MNLLILMVAWNLQDLYTYFTASDEAIIILRRSCFSFCGPTMITLILWYLSTQ